MTTRPETLRSIESWYIPLRNGIWFLSATLLPGMILLACLVGGVSIEPDMWKLFLSLAALCAFGFVPLLGIGTYAFVRRDDTCTPVIVQIKTYRIHEAEERNRELKRIASKQAAFENNVRAKLDGILLNIEKGDAETKNKPKTQTRVKSVDDVIPSNKQVWDDAKARFAEVSMKLGAFEADWDAVLFSKPLLRDTSEPVTARFYEAFYTASSLNSDVMGTRDEIDAFSNAVATAQRCWDAAEKNALQAARANRTLNGKLLTSDERSQLRRAQRALFLVLDPSTPDNEASLAWSRVQSIVNELGLQPSDDLKVSLTSALPKHMRELVSASNSLTR